MLNLEVGKVNMTHSSIMLVVMKRMNLSLNKFGTQNKESLDFHISTIELNGNYTIQKNKTKQI